MGDKLSQCIRFVYMHTHKHTSPMPHRVSITFADEKDGSETTVRVPTGLSLMEVAHSNDIDLECRRGR